MRACLWHFRVMARISLGRTVAMLGLLGLACHSEPTRQPASDPSPAATEPEPKPEPKPEPDPEPEPITELERADPDRVNAERPPYTPTATLGEPIEIRLATGTRAVYAEPNYDAARRGRIRRKLSFFVYEHREGPDCDKPWAKVAEAGWICLERTASTVEQPRSLPVLASDDILPFIYARHVGHENPETPAIPVYASVAAFNRGDSPIETLAAYGSYAFIRSIYNRGTRVYQTANRRVVAAAELDEFKPSKFAGHELDDLATGAVPPGTTLAWAVRWKTLIRSAPDPEAGVVARVPYHDTLHVVGEGVLGADDERWFEVAEGPGWIRDHDIRRFLPVAPPTPTLAGQITVDIDLDQQVLSVWRDDEPVFATLISSGKRGDQTPVGLYRIETKWAYGKMASLANAEDPYYVDAVPWAMYFDGRYALHAAYWHDLFGHRMSHGCVNLSPRDAKRVFDLVTPTLPHGWLLVHEHARDPGAVVRVRNSDASVPDHRDPLATPKLSSSG